MSQLNNTRIIEAIRCPVCDAAMEIVGGSLLCTGARKHCFDFGASGYVNLCRPGQSGGGDAKAAVRARSRFLDGGFYAPIANAIVDCLGTLPIEKDSFLIDAGCGEGYYTEHMAKAGYSVMGADLSKTAADVAAKRAKLYGHGRSLYVVSSVYELPVGESVAAGVINIFAPCAEEEFCRVLRDGGFLIVVHAGEQHLMGLKRILYAQTHENTLRADLPKQMILREERAVRYSITVDGNQAVQDLFAMTPYYWRTSQSDAERLMAIDSLETEIDVTISVYQKKGA